MNIIICFDGGCRPKNPGNKYGSFEVNLNGRQVRLESRFELGWGTNNEAEFEALEAALNWTVIELARSGNNPAQFDLMLYSDSTIVVNRMNNGRNWKSKNEPQIRMAERAARCRRFTDQFKSCRAKWNPRDANVARFGH